MPSTTIDLDREKLTIRMSRVFNATRERLWQAHTDPEQMKQWFGPAKYQTTIDKMDVKVGGEWRFIHSGDGQEYAFHGVYQDLDEPNSITWTFVFEGIPSADDHAVTETVSFTELPDGTTRVDTFSQYLSKEDFEGMVQSGMEDGARESWDRLAKLVEE